MHSWFLRIYLRRDKVLRILYLTCLMSLAACAQLHHVQLGDVDARPGFFATPFDIKVSETGVNLGEAVRIQRSVLAHSQSANAAGNVAAIVSLFQTGPRTGDPVYVRDYAERLIYAIFEMCPNGHVSDLSSIRETRKYSVISGEIVRVKGVCLRPRQPASIELDNLDHASDSPAPKVDVTQ